MPSLEGRPEQDFRFRPPKSTSVKRPGVLLLAALVGVSSLVLASPSPAVSVGTEPTLDRWLTGQLSTASPLEQVPVIVNAGTQAEATAAIRAAGLREIRQLPLIGASLATGTPAGVRALALQPGVDSVEGADRPLAPQMDTSHRATRADLAEETFTSPDGGPYDGTGVGVMVIDGGIDGTHPMFVDDAGVSKVKRNLEVVPFAALADAENPSTDLVVDDPDGDNNTDDVAGHGTHVAGTVAGYERTTASGRVVRGGAPGATLYGISVATAGSNYYGATAAQYWVLEHAADPCGDGTCPAIKAVNNSYGPIGGSPYSPNSAANEIQRASIAKGVTWVWAAGNDGGDGSADATNGSAKEPTPGVLSVAAYDDAGQGTRDGALADFSSRGAAGDPSTWPDLSAPGVDIQSACRLTFNDCALDVLNDLDPDYGDLSGTSMAAPHIAGYVALLLQADPTLTPGAIELVLEDTAYKFGSGYVADPANTGSTSSFDKGHGLVDVTAALARVLGVADPGGTGDCSVTVMTDPEGDETLLTGIGPGTPPVASPDVDIVSVAAEEVGSAVRLSIGVNDLGETPKSAGDAVRTFFAAAGTAFTLDMNRDLATPTAPTAVLSRPDPNDPTGLETIEVGRYTPVFDSVADVAYVDLPVAVLGVAGGDDLTGVRVLWRRSFEVLAAPADEASALCPLRIQAPVVEQPTKPGKGHGKGGRPKD